MALAQIATCPGQIRHNLDRHYAMLERARAVDADLVLFPELSVSGYLLAHGVHEQALDLADPILDPLKKASREIAMVVGLPLRLPGGGIANAAALLEGGEVRAVHRKLYLPTYGMFDEGRYFVSGQELNPLECSLGRFGVLICEDAWHLSSAVLLYRHGVDAFLIVAGGPTELDGSALPAGTRRWHSIVAAMAATLVTPVFFANRCGWEEGIMFGGGSWAVDGRANALSAAGSATEETLLLARLSRAAIRHIRSLTPIPSTERLDLWRTALEARDA